MLPIERTQVCEKQEKRVKKREMVGVGREKKKSEEGA